MNPLGSVAASLLCASVAHAESPDSLALGVPKMEVFHSLNTCKMRAKVIS
jgi:hypothetical protein